MSLSADDKLKLTRFLSSNIMRDQVTVRHGWENFMKTQAQHDAIVIDVENRMALYSLLGEINALNQDKNPEERIILRAAAGGKNKSGYSESFSAPSVVNADIIVRLTGKTFSKISRLENNIVRVGASMQIGEIDKFLYEKFQLTMPSSSLIPYVTAAGLAAAGGHGTGKDQPSFAGLVRGMTLCLETGEIVHIDQTHPDFATILGANNGLFGIVLDMDIQCIPAQKLQCVMEKRSAIEFMEEVQNGLFDNDPYVSAMYIPTYLPDELTNRTINNVIIYRWRPVPLDTKDVDHEPFFENLSQKVQTDLGAAINIPEVLRTYPKLIPYYQRYMSAPLTVGKSDALSVGPWHEMAHYRTAFPRDLTEICGMIPVKDQPRNQPQGTEIVKTLKHVITLLGEHAKRGEYPVTYALYFRYLQGSNGGLSITDHPDGHHICAIDITTNENIKGYPELQQSMQDFFLNEMHGKFHWGKNAPMNIDYEKMYGPRWQETKTVLEKWHQTHNIKTEKSMLLNPLFSHALGYPAPSLVDTDTLPASVCHTEKNYRVAVNAGKMLNKIADKSEDAIAIRNEINQDIKNTKRCTLFSSAKNTPQTDAVEEKKSTCVLL